MAAKNTSESRKLDATSALVTGAGGGIGLALVEALLGSPAIERVYAGCREPAKSTALAQLAAADERVVPITLDITDEDTLDAAAAVVGRASPVDLLINTAGILHDDDGMRPEKRLADVKASNLLRAYEINAIGAMRLARTFEPSLKQSAASRFVCLSARVGSIGDNRLGGWYAYRASKAALNMLLKTLAIEWARLRPPIVCAALHPGTVATDLSAPFTANGSSHKVFTAAESAGYLLSVIDTLAEDQSGGFYAWDGKEIPW